MLKTYGVELKKFSWQWNLCIDVRKHLNSQISDTIVARIISDFEIYERKRLHGEFAVLGKPGSIELLTTANSLNSTYKELIYWSESGYTHLQEELKKRIEDCKSNLGTIARQSISGVWLDYKELEKHSFYYNAALTLLSDFNSKLNNLLVSDEIDNGLKLIDHAFLYTLKFPGKTRKHGEEKVRQLEYLKENRLPVDNNSIDNFSKYIRVYRKPGELSKSKINNRLEQLDKILPSISNPQIKATWKKVKNSLNDELADPE